MPADATDRGGHTTDARAIGPGVVSASLSLARRFFWRGVAYSAVVELLSVVVLAPLITWSLYRLLAVSGDGARVNYDLVDVFLSPRTALLLLWAPVAAAAGIIVVGGLVLQAGAAQRGERLGVRPALKEVFGRLYLLRGAAVLKGALYLAVVLPVVFGVVSGVVTGSFVALPRSAVFEILPDAPGLLAALVVGSVLLVIVAAWLTSRWLFVIPLVCLEHAPLREAFETSVRISRGQRGTILRWVAICALGAALLALVGGGAAGGISALGVTLASGVGATTLVLVGALLVVVNTLVLSACACIGLIWFVSINSVLFFRVRGEVRREMEADDGTLSGRVRRAGLARAGLVAGVLVVATGLTIPGVSAEIASIDRGFEITAHRGAAARAPENTLAAVNTAIEDRADWIEIDVQQTSDGGIVLLHDLTLTRTAGRPEGAWELTTREITGVDVGSWFGPEFAGELLPTLQQTINAVRNRARLNIEVKLHGRESGLAQSLVDLLRAEDAIGWCAVTSLDGPFLREIREIEPALRVGLIVTASIGDLTRQDVDMLIVQPLIASPAFIARAHSRGRSVHVWSLSDPANIGSVIDRGAAGVLSPDPALARRVLEARSPADDARALLVRLFGSGRRATAPPEGWE